MKTSIKPVPEGFHTVTPYLLVPDVPAVIDFLKRVFNAKETYRSTAPDGLVNHASVQIGNSMVMMGAARGSWQPETTTLYVYLEEMDSVYLRAVEAGAESVQEPKTQFYGDRTAALKDPAGNKWYLATHVEDVDPGELQRRMIAAQSQRAASS
jgi:PhnB protein